MRSARRGHRTASLAATAAASLLLAACGGPDLDTAARQIAALVPDDCAAIVRIASLDTLSRQVAHVAAAQGMEPEGMDARDALVMARGMLGDPRLVDSSLPLVVLVAPRRAQPATVVALVPTTDTTAFAASLPAGKAEATEGDYVVAPLAGDYARPSKPNPLPNDMLTGAIAIDADVEALAKAFGPMIGLGLKSFEATMAGLQGPDDATLDMQEVASVYTDLARTALESCQRLKLGIDMPNGVLEVRASMQARTGSSLDGWSAEPTDVRTLAAALTGTAPIEAITDIDWQVFWPRYEAAVDRLIDLYPEPVQAPMRKMMAIYPGMFARGGNGMAMQLDLLGQGGLRFDAVLMPPDSAALLEDSERFLQSDAVKELDLFSSTTERKQDGDTSLLHANIAFDLDKLGTFTRAMATTPAPEVDLPDTSDVMRQMLGDGTCAATFAVRDGRAGLAFGGDHAARATQLIARTDGHPSSLLQTGLDEVAGCSPMFVERIDFSALLVDTMALVGERSPTGAPPPCDMLLYGGIRGSEWRAGLKLDVIGMNQLFAGLTWR